MTRWTSRSTLAALVVGLGACAPKGAAIVETSGECADVYQASVCTWARMQGDSVIDVGATVPVASVENAPAEGGEMTWPPAAAAVLQMPAAVVDATGLTHLTVYWEAMGHPPGPYLTPHFDFHFYTVSIEDRMAIDCTDLSKPAALADGYSLPDVELPPPMASMLGVGTLVGLCVPQMGMHSLLTAELEGSSPFRGTMVIGYNKGQSVFLEPMITKAMLMEKASFDLPVPTIPGIPGKYPRKFHAEYDAQQNAYRFVLSEFSAGS